MTDETYDVVIVGTGIAGAIIALQLGRAGRNVMLIEAGDALPNGREEYLRRFYLDTNKFPEAPYPENKNAMRASVEDLFNPRESYLDQAGPLPFGSTYERRGGGTMWHWHGTSLRHVPNDFKLLSRFGHGVDWPIDYEDLGIKERAKDSDGRGLSYYDMAEREIGVSADVVDQQYGEPPVAFITGYEYPNPGIPLSTVDRFYRDEIKDLYFEGQQLRVIPLPAGRNSRPYDGRRSCAGNTNCVPICPIQAKYDPTVTLFKAFNLKNVQARFRHVASKLLIDSVSGLVQGVECIEYAKPEEPSPIGTRVIKGKRYVLACHAIETPRLLLMSGLGKVNDCIGRYLMDHPFYLRWGISKKQIFPYRGPLTTAGFLGLRDGDFRSKRAAYRLEFGNDGWALANLDPYTTLRDLIDGTNDSGTNCEERKYHGRSLVERLNYLYTRHCRLGFEFEQLPDKNNRVTLSESRWKDPLGLPRPKVTYSMSDYERRGFESADRLTKILFEKLEVEDKTRTYLTTEEYQSSVEWKGKVYPYMGAGHIMGTFRMGSSKNNSVVDREQRSWDCRNLFLVGTGVFPTGATANPTLTVAALAFWAADTIDNDLT